MSSRTRLGFVSLALVLSGVLSIPRPCWARGAASVTRIEVTSDGRARVQHSLRVEPSSPAALEASLSDVTLDGIWPAPRAGLPQPSLARQLPWVLAAALAYAWLITAKARAVQRAAALRGCRVRALVGVRLAVRAAGAGLLWVAASCAVIWFDAQLLGALWLLCALALATHRPPAIDARLRGPGQWQPLDGSALAPVATAPLPGAWLDVGRPRGLLLLLAAFGAITALAIRVFASSPYAGACLLLGSSALLPVFCTGRAAELAEPGLAQSRRFLARVLKALAGTPDLVLQPLGRFCTGASELDELRLALHPAQALPGLIGMELALEFRPVLTGQSAWPVLVIRVADGSPCQLALPRQLSWSRGRSVEERAALVRPKLPSVSLSVELIRELLAAARAAPAPARPVTQKLSAQTRARPRATAA
jgi:hypothetical protein